MTRDKALSILNDPSYILGRDLIRSTRCPFSTLEKKIGVKVKTLKQWFNGSMPVPKSKMDLLVSCSKDIDQLLQRDDRLMSIAFPYDYVPMDIDQETDSRILFYYGYTPE